MGYTTDFIGSFTLDMHLDKETHEFLRLLAETRRMKRTVAPEYGTDGEFYVEGAGDFGQDHEPNVVDYNTPPQTQPGLWCQWRPSDDGFHIEWDGNEKFYRYVEWLQYIIKKVLIPKGYTLNGEVGWVGEDPGDTGTIRVVNNEVTVLSGKGTP